MIKDSGNRTLFESGAVRDIQVGKGRCDLMPLDIIAEIYDRDDQCEKSAIFKSIYKFQEYGDYHALINCLIYFDLGGDNWEDTFLEVAKHFEEGAAKYGDNNWRKGIPVRCYIDSAVRHYLKYLRGDDDERHDRAFVWNILCCMWTCKHHPELNDYRKEETES